MDRFHFFKKRSFCFENDEEKTKNETIVFINDRIFKNIFILNRRFKKRSFSVLDKNNRFKKTIVFRFK